MFYANPSTPQVRLEMRRGRIGMFATPRQGNRLMPGVPWAADNGGFTGGYAGDGPYLGWLDSLAGYRQLCGFVTAPDVLCDASATLERSRPMLPRIREAGYPAALVAQNGQEELAVPWDEFDVLFLGGDTAWKLGPPGRRLTAGARAHGKPVHMGRVNSLRRLRYAAAIGCDSADGTYLAFGPDENLPKLLGWLRDVNDQGVLWEAMS